MAEVKDPYAVLGVARTATQDEIREAYRKLAKKLHPDLNPGNQDAEHRFKDVAAAYQLIGTPEQREKFDRGEFEEPAGPPPGGPRRYYWRSGQGPERYASQEVDEEFLRSIFENLGGEPGGGYAFHRAGASRFGMGGAGSDYGTGTYHGPGVPPMRGADRTAEMEVDFRDAMLGVSRQVRLPHGERIEVRIPPGVQTGARMRVAGKGEPGVQGGASGDLLITLRVRPSERFRQEGDALYVDVPISLQEAVFGGEVRVSTLEGQAVLKVPRRVNTGTRLRLRGKGALDRASGRRGDLYAVLKVVLPDHIDPELESALKRWSETHSYNPREREAA